MFAWSGNKGSVLGQTSLYGKLYAPLLSASIGDECSANLGMVLRSGIEFWTQHKVRFLHDKLTSSR